MRLFLLVMLLVSAPLEAGENVWTPIGPEGGTVTDLAFAANGRTVYAGTEFTGVFKSVNTGRTWFLTDTSLRGAVRDLETDPVRPGTVYAATSQGIWKSDDAGRTWRNLTRLPEETADVRAVVADPLSPGVVYISAAGGFEAPRVFRSADGGASWQLANAGLPEGTVRAIAVHPRKRGVLFAATISGIFRSNNSGRTWRRSGLRGSDVIDLKIDPVQPHRLYAVRIVTDEEESPPTRPEIFVSEDEGGSWRLSASGLEGLHAGRLAVDPFTPGIAYFFSPFSGLYKTTDGGGHWTAALVLDSGGQAYSGFQAMAFHPRQPGIILLGRAGDGEPAILRTTQGGLTWSRSGAGLRALGVKQVVADPGTPGVLYALSGTALWKTGDAGRSWRKLEVPSITLLQVVLDPRTPSTLYLAAAGSTYKSVDGGETWRRIEGVSLRVLAIDPADPDTLYGADFTTIFKSTDAGEHWVDLPATRGFQSTVLTVDPNRPSTVYADFRHLERDGVSRSTDGGATWSTILEIRSAPLAPRLTFSDIAVQPGNPDRLLAAFFRSGFDFIPTRGGVYRTSDGGATWSLSRLEARNPPPPALALLFDPRRPSRAYAGSTDGRAYVSEDAGVTWSFLGQGLPSASVLDLEADPFGPDTIYAATEGGLFTLTQTTGH
jgi:photosystem II stability/assembly factor-like uncharacterized protein